MNQVTNDSATLKNEPGKSVPASKTGEKKHKPNTNKIYNVALLQVIKKVLPTTLTTNNFSGLIGSFIKLNVQTFQPLILFYRRGNFVYHHCGFTPIFQPLSLDYYRS